MSPLFQTRAHVLRWNSWNWTLWKRFSNIRAYPHKNFMTKESCELRGVADDSVLWDVTPRWLLEYNTCNLLSFEISATICSQHDATFQETWIFIKILCGRIIVHIIFWSYDIRKFITSFHSVTSTVCIIQATFCNTSKTNFNKCVQYIAGIKLTSYPFSWHF